MNLQPVFFFLLSPARCPTSVGGPGCLGDAQTPYLEPFLSLCHRTHSPYFLKQPRLKAGELSTEPVLIPGH